MKIFSITVSFNPDIPLLNRHLNSIPSSLFKVLVDNGSINRVQIEELTKKISNIVLIQNNENLGLGKAQNIGINYALINDATDVLLLDQDSIINNEILLNLLESRNQLISNEVKVGAIGPIYTNENTGEIYPITKYIGPFIKRIVNFNKPVEASFIIASGCLINKDVLKTVGLMNEEYFIDFIDVEWCFRAKNKGFKVYSTPFAKMIHNIGDSRMSILGRSISVHSPVRRYYLCRNSIFMIRDNNIDLGYKIREIAFNLLRLLVFFILSKDRIMYLKYSYKGYKDGVFNKTGSIKLN
jgi:rhamnosyltransferase